MKIIANYRTRFSKYHEFFQNKSNLNSIKNIYLPRIARVKTTASAPSLIVLVLKPFPSVQQKKVRRQ